VELARRFAMAFNDGLDEWIACHAEDVVHVTAPDWPEGGTYRGREAVRGLWESILAEHSEHEIVVDEVTDVDEHRVLSKLRWRARGAASGVVTTTPVYTATTIDQAGLMSRIEYFLDYDQALKAAGLSE
jgi:SnoaL-like protein